MSREFTFKDSPAVCRALSAPGSAAQAPPEQTKIHENPIIMGIIVQTLSKQYESTIEFELSYRFVWLVCVLKTISSYLHSKSRITQNIVEIDSLYCMGKSLLVGVR